MSKEKLVYKNIKPMVRVSFVGKEKFLGKIIVHSYNYTDCIF